jgi:hypothetical protein
MQHLCLGILLSFAVPLLAMPRPAAAEEAKGSLSYGSRTVELAYAYLVTGPDAVDTAKNIREIVFSSIDLKAKIEACKTMSCVSGEVTEGMTVDLDGGPRINYWVAINDQRVQYSGTTKVSTLETRTDEPAKLAGTLHIDDTSAGGPKVDVDFDVTVLKELSAAR